MKYAILLMLCIGMVSAMQVIPIENQVTIDWRGERDFIIYMPDGFERHFTWDLNQTHTDVTFTQTIYHEINEKSWCSQYSNIDEYHNITLGLSSMLKVCGNIIYAWNKTDDYRKQASEAIKDRDIYQSMYDICEEKRKSLVNESKEYDVELAACKADKDSIQTQVNSLKNQQSDYNSCSQDLTSALSDKNTFGIGGAAIGLAIGYFMWNKRRRGIAPSEHQEVGSYSDAISEGTE